VNVRLAAIRSGLMAIRVFARVTTTSERAAVIVD
jgi:hypothetical protein